MVVRGAGVLGRCAHHSEYKGVPSNWRDLHWLLTEHYALVKIKVERVVHLRMPL